MAAERPTIAMIAREVGVSVPTVSKVLNGRTDVAPATRARVEEVLARHQYRKPTARSLTRSGRLIELVIHEADTIWAMELIKGVERVAGPARIGVVLSELGGSHRPRQEWIDDVMARRPLGVVFVLSELDGRQREQLASRGIPYVVVDTQGEIPRGVHTVGSNNWNGGLIATRHLIALGHRRIGVVAGPRDILCSRARVDGYRSAHDEAGIQLDPAIARWGNFRSEAGYEHGGALLDLPERPTAIFAGSDLQALGVVRAAQERGLRIPEDLSLVGYDNLPITEWLNPPLTTVTQPLQEMAGLATRLVLELAQGETPSSTHVELGTELVVRGSTGPVPAA
ncbi:LacI family transcriptional regulator [Salana multivorans]|uniref:LacI family transcriptional regulator n=2 Tax=Salana multivorans TaxID=120377 RepID=A0A3N2DBB1_9MICO|nr:LacI family DNA-binding transcriptional regulator [Salana multivorans]ROR97002.1 LacI family transcriptional regulator [Salana multivorans]